MKSILNTYLGRCAAICAFFLIASCNKDKLSPEPETAFSEEQAFANPERIRQQVFGAYSAVKNGNFLGGRGLVYQDVRGEDWLNITGNGVTALAAWNFSIVSSDNQTENFWNTGYAAINRANVVLQGLDENEAKLGQALANNYRGEMRFLRAVSYFYLVNTYGRRPFNADNGASPGLPLRLTANKGAATDTINLVRSTVAEVYNQILADLNFAEANLPASYGANGDTTVVRAHKNSAIAFKTRVYLNMARYTDVITEANKLVPVTGAYVAPTGVQNRLEGNILNVFRSYAGGGREMIFGLPMAQSNGPGTQNGLALYQNAEFALNPAGILGNAQFTATDARRTLFVVNTAAPFRYSKFNDDNNNYVPIIRYSEVMLNLAEALARTSAGVDLRALALLNAVHQRSDPGTTLAPLTSADLLTAILTERRIEFLGEGLRSFDIMRQNLPFPAKGSVTAIPPTALNYMWPIPASEILYNKLATQNQ